LKLEIYLQEIPGHRIERFTSILNLIREMYPDASESMKYHMPTFESDAGWIAIGNKKNYISVYTCMEKHITPFKALYPEVKTGKGCINLRDKDVISLAGLKPVIKSAMEYRHA